MNHESRKPSPAAPRAAGGASAGIESFRLRGDGILRCRPAATERDDSLRRRSGNSPAPRSGAGGGDASAGAEIPRRRFAATQRRNSLRRIAAAILAAAATLPLTATPALAAEKAAIFAGGCFWCVESDFEKVPGVIEAVSGYTGGELENPTYRNHGKHIEAVRIMYDDAKVDYATLLDIFWRSVDPLDSGGQFCDRGHSYTTAIFALDDEQLRIAEASKAAVDASGKLPSKVATPIRKAGAFTDAETYHQDYYKKNPIRYRFYRFNCGRDARVKELWGDEAHAGIDHG